MVGTLSHVTPILIFGLWEGPTLLCAHTIFFFYILAGKEREREKTERRRGRERATMHTSSLVSLLMRTLQILSDHGLTLMTSLINSLETSSPNTSPLDVRASTYESFL